MTRSRARLDGIPRELVAEYYARRASEGLIVTEGTQPSDNEQGYLFVNLAPWQRCVLAAKPGAARGTGYSHTGRKSASSLGELSALVSQFAKRKLD
jgi:2,4-dienoyl-CoA reductase-like NADH-dependent reductase (Old Yellow Enzyme family)